MAEFTIGGGVNCKLFLVKVFIVIFIMGMGFAPMRKSVLVMGMRVLLITVGVFSWLGRTKYQSCRHRNDQYEGKFHRFLIKM